MILLSGIQGIDETGVLDSSTKINQILSENTTNGCTLVIPRDAKIKLSSDVVLVAKQSIIGYFNPHDASGLTGTDGNGNPTFFDYKKLSSQLILSNNASIRLDNGSKLSSVFVWRAGLLFSVDQGDFSSWTGNGVVLGYGNDQVVQDCLIVGFEYPLTTITTRGLNGPGRVILNRIYIDGKNGIRLCGSYDTAFIDRIKIFGFVTQAYAGTPAEGETYDPRKDRRPGIGFELVDRCDGTKIGAIEVFGYSIGFKANAASWCVSNLSVDYPTTPTYNTGSSGTIGVLLTKDVDPTVPRNIDYDPSQIGILQIWSTEIGLKLIGNAGRMAQIGAGTIVNTYGDAIQIDGGGLIAPNMRFALNSGAPVNFISQPNTKSIIKGRANQFGAGRNSNNVPVIKIPAESNINLVDIKLDNDQSIGASYFNNYPTLPAISSADPLMLPSYCGNETEYFLVTGSNGFSGIYGLRPGTVNLHFESSISIFAGNFSGGIRLPNNAANISISAGTSISFEYNGSLDRWNTVSMVN